MISVLYLSAYRNNSNQPSMITDRRLNPSIRFISLEKHPLELKTRVSANKIHLFWVYRSKDQLRQFDRMLRQEYKNKVTLVKCSKIQALPSLEMSSSSIILLNKIYEKQVMHNLGDLQSMFLIYSNEAEGNLDMANETSVCFMSYSEQALIRYFKQLLGLPRAPVTLQGNTKGAKTSQRSLQTKLILPRIKTNQADEKPLKQMKAQLQFMNDNWRYPGPGHYHPDDRTITKKKIQKGNQTMEMKDHKLEKLKESTR